MASDEEREALARDAFIEHMKLDARNSMRSDPRVWHEALEAALDKTLPEFWAQASAFHRQGQITEAMVEAAAYVIDEGAMEAPQDYPLAAEAALSIARAALEAAEGQRHV